MPMAHRIGSLNFYLFDFVVFFGSFMGGTDIDILSRPVNHQERHTMNHSEPTTLAERQEHRAARVQTIKQQLDSSAATELSDIERADLQLMREEEKVARDVYAQLYSRWNIMPFGNIKGSEQAHMDMVGLLLERYAVRDLTHGLPVGRFGMPHMQALYDQLMMQGLCSLEDSIRVGLHIEELDIADLRLTRSHTSNPDILQVYAELERGSRNHLRAFYRWKQSLDVSYEPTHLSPADFENIGRSPKEMCH